MHKVLIVDDEPIIREGLISIVNWKDMNCEVCGEASDGLMAKDKIIELQPNIVIVDIKMPGCDGLTLIRTCKEIYPNIKFILLTGHRDFDLVQEALKVGAFDYLLKPSKIPQLVRVIERATEEIDTEQMKKDQLKAYEKYFEESIPLLKEKFLYDVMYKIMTNPVDIDENCGLYHIDLRRYYVLVVEVDEEQAENNTPYDRQLRRFGITNTCLNIFSAEANVLKVGLNLVQTAFVISIKDKIDSDSSHRKELWHKIEKVQKVVDQCFDFSISIGVSSIGSEISELPGKLQECLQGIEYKFYMGNGAVIFYEDLEKVKRLQIKPNFDKEKEELIRGVSIGNEKLVNSVLSRLKEEVINCQKLNEDELKALYCEIINKINEIRIRFKENLGHSVDVNYNIANLYSMINESHAFLEIHELTEQIVLQLTNNIQNTYKKDINQVIKRAIDYIEVNYNQPITLNHVAEYTYVSSSYLSRMFKKELGINFVDYLNEFRIDKAKELLKNTQDKTYEVAYKVGVQDPHYFSKIFKKYTNLSPKEFRQKASNF